MSRSILQAASWGRCLAAVIVAAVAATVLILGAGDLLAGGKPAPPPSVNAVFRSLSPFAFPGDTIAGDGSAYPPAPISKGGHYGEGAYINGNGGLTIGLVKGDARDRTMWFDFRGSPIQDFEVSGASLCNRSTYFVTGGAGNTVAAAWVTLQLNAIDPVTGAVLGLASVKPGDPPAAGFGKINFSSGAPADPGVWTLRFPPAILSIANTTPPGSKSQWTIAWVGGPSGALLQCTANGQITDDSWWVMPFEITVNQQ